MTTLSCLICVLWPKTCSAAVMARTEGLGAHPTCTARTCWTSAAVHRKRWPGSICCLP